MAELAEESGDRIGWIETRQDGDVLTVRAGGRWTVADALQLDPLTRDRLPAGVRHVEADLSEIEALDTAGAWILWRWGQEFREHGIDIEMIAARPEDQTLFDLVETSQCTADDTVRERPHAFAELLEDMGRTTFWAVGELTKTFSFLGQAMVTFAWTAVRPRTWRTKALVNQIEQTGIRALPIVGLLSFLVGVVMAYQGSVQLAVFGAQVFTVDFVGIATLREIGVLMTAIMVAGRSGSAFTAQIGTMEVSEEVDAIETLGLDPIQVLVLPRLLALIITLPLLTFWADVMGVLGGAVMIIFDLGMSPTQFLTRLQEALSYNHFFVGIVKAPVFAIIIALVGCHEGLVTKRNAESVGSQTTLSVVQSIFMVIVADALFSIMFSVLGI